MGDGRPWLETLTWAFIQLRWAKTGHAYAWCTLSRVDLMQIAKKGRGDRGIINWYSTSFAVCTRSLEFTCLDWNPVRCSNTSLWWSRSDTTATVHHRFPPCPGLCSTRRAPKTTRCRKRTKWGWPQTLIFCTAPLRINHANRGWYQTVYRFNLQVNIYFRITYHFSIFSVSNNSGHIIQLKKDETEIRNRGELCPN